MKKSNKNINNKIKRKHIKEQKRMKGMLRMSASSTINICGQGRLIEKTIFKAIFK